MSNVRESRMQCEYVKNNLVLNAKFSADEVEAFKLQFKAVLDEASTSKGIVYVFTAQKNIPRLKGESNIIYIGQTSQSLYKRYISKVWHEAKYFWPRYNYIISNFGHISIEIYETSAPKITESKFLYQYQCAHLELPPINLDSYQEKYL